METVADGVMYLYGQRDEGTLVLLHKPAEGEDGQQVGTAFRQVKIKAGKAFPRYHGNGEAVRRRIWLAFNSKYSAVFCQIAFIGSGKIAVTACNFRPEISKGFRFRLKNRIAGQHFAENAGTSFTVQNRAELGKLIDGAGQRVQQRRIQAQVLLSDVGNVDISRQTVGTGNLVQVMLKKSAAG